MSNFFAIIPVDVFMDDRLSKTELRVLGAILSCRQRDTNIRSVGREQIQERCGLPICKISTATTRLVELGWLKKIGNGGRSQKLTYEFLVPDLPIKTVTDSVTVYPSKTVTNSETVTESETVTDSVTKTVTDSVTPLNNIYINNNNINNKKNNARGADEVFALLALFGIVDELAMDFIQHRKAKKAVITKTALEGFKREADKAGIAVDEAVRLSIERGWTGFKAEWVVNNIFGGNYAGNRGVSESKSDKNRRIRESIRSAHEAAVAEALANGTL